MPGAWQRRVGCNVEVTLPRPCNAQERIAALGYEPVSFVDYAALDIWLATEVADLIMLDMAAIPSDVAVRDINALARGAPAIVTPRLQKDVTLHSAIAAHYKHLRDPMSTWAVAGAIRLAIQGERERQRSIRSTQASRACNRITLHSHARNTA